MVMRILVVDDNAAYRRSFSEFLHTQLPDFPVIQAGSIDEAWQRIAIDQPELVFIDIKLQQENGLDLVRRLRREHPHILVAVMTGSDFPEYQQAAYDAGAYYFVSKGATNGADILMLINAVRETHRTKSNPTSASLPLLQRYVLDPTAF